MKHFLPLICFFSFSTVLLHGHAATGLGGATKSRMTINQIAADPTIAGGRTSIDPTAADLPAVADRQADGQPTTKDQVVIGGVVRDSLTRKPIEGVNVMLQTPDRKGILKYSITKEDGRYELSFPKRRDSVLIVVTGFNVKTQAKLPAARSQTVDFLMQAATINIGTVSIKAPDISRRNDTLNYRVESFIDTSDRSIGDVFRLSFLIFAPYDDEDRNRNSTGQAIQTDHQTVRR